MKLFGAVLAVSGCWLALTVARDHSIMEMINTDRVKLLLSRQEQLNNSKESLPTPLTTNSVDSDLADATNLPHKSGRRAPPPDISTVLSEIGRPGKVLESDRGMLVTKKRYVRKDWCKTEPIVQTVREDGCLPKNVVNRFCYGQCNSFFIPKNGAATRLRKRQPEEWEENSAFRSCGVCKPKKSAWVQVTLECPGTDQPLRRRRVHKVKQCQCMAAKGF